MDRRVRVEPRIDFFQCLGTDVSRLITNFLDDEGDLVRFTAVSRFWREYGEQCNLNILYFFVRLASHLYTFTNLELHSP